MSDILFIFKHVYGDPNQTEKIDKSKACCKEAMISYDY